MSRAPATAPAAARRRRARGFTLLEVMVAIAILAGALLAISELVGASLRNHVRAIHLETATLLARGKLAELEDGFERTGFRDFSQEEEGTFEEDGHPEVRWKVEVVRPEVELGPERLLQLLGGSSDLATLLGLPTQAGAQQSGARPVAPADPKSAAMGAALNQQLTVMGESIKKGVRELRLTVSWPEGSSTDSFTVVTHLAVLTAKEGL